MISKDKVMLFEWFIEKLNEHDIRETPPDKLDFGPGVDMMRGEASNGTIAYWLEAYSVELMELQVRLICGVRNLPFVFDGIESAKSYIESFVREMTWETPYIDGVLPI